MSKKLKILANIAFDPVARAKPKLETKTDTKVIA